jgi:CelD/BcsL family acetyltransferase involved in cellulose biosynthesis
VMSGMPAWNLAAHLFEGVGEQGVNWFLMHAGLMKSRASAGATALALEVLPTFDFTSPEYADLFKRSEATAFQHPIWLDRTFARLVKPSDRSAAILVGRSHADRRLMLVVPMIRRKLGPLSMLDAADLEVADYNALVFDRSAARDPAVVHQVQRALRNLRLIRIRKVRDDDIGNPLRDLSARIRTMDYKAHEVELAAPLENWQARILKPDFARFLRSKRKRLAAKGVIALKEVSGPAGIRAAFERMRDFRQVRWASDSLSDPALFEFYVDVAVSGSGTGFARTYALTVNGTILSVLFGVHHRGRFCFLLLGFDRQKFRNHSTGLLLLESIIEDCIRRSDDVFDLTIGDEEYKQNFATRSVSISEFWIGQRPWVQIAPLALNMARKARSLFRKPPRIRSQPGETRLGNQ